jgi:hypothetical protein
MEVFTQMSLTVQQGISVPVQDAAQLATILPDVVRQAERW